MVSNSAKGASIATGCTVEIETRPGLKSNLENKALERLFQRMFDELGQAYIPLEKAASIPPGGSTDFSNVTHVVPEIHPLIGMGVEDVPAHNRALVDLTLTAAGNRNLEISIKSMAMAAVELKTQPELLKQVKNEFEGKRANVRSIM